MPVSKPLDLITIGRSSVDLDGAPVGGRLEDMAAYAQSKLALTMWSHAMEKAHEEEDPAIIAVNPGSRPGSNIKPPGA